MTSEPRTFLDGKVTLYGGDNRDVLKSLPDNSIDSVVTDPPYALVSITKRFGKPGSAPAQSGKSGVYARASAGFMGQQWDTGEVAFAEEFWAEILRVLKPGGHLVAFSGTRTYHRMTCAIEDAGFEIRDSIYWHYGSGFPKSLNVGKQLDADGARCVCGKDVHHLRRDLDADDAPSGFAQPDVRPNVREGADQEDGNGATVAAQPASDRDLSGMRKAQDAPSGLAAEGGPADLLQTVQRRAPRAGLGKARAQGGGGPQDVHGDARTQQSGLEGRRDTQETARQLRERALRKMSVGPSVDGPEGRLRHGAPPCDGKVDKAPADAAGVRAPSGPQPAQQLPEQSGAVAVQPHTQASGAWPTCGRCSKPIVPDGLGTALKPATEPICLARKPLIGTVAQNVLTHGTGALNIDGCRIETADDLNGGAYAGEQRERAEQNQLSGGNLKRGIGGFRQPTGRFPANLLHDGSDEVVGCFPDTASGTGAVKRQSASDTNGNAGAAYGAESRPAGTPMICIGDSGSAARFFYTSKAGADDRLGSKHPCLPPGELVLTDAGYEPIETVGVGRMVYADDGQFHRVIDRFPSPCETQVFEINVEGTNLRTRATDNHPFLVWRPKITYGRARDTVGVGEASWMNADSISVGDYLMTPVAALPEVSGEESADWWFAAGLWMAEGTVLTNGHGSSAFPQYTLAAHESEHVETLRRVFGNVRVYERPNSGALSVVVFVSGVVERFVSLCGRGAHNKYVSPEVLSQSDEKRRAFLLGFLAGDGCRVRDKYRAKTASMRLASTLPLLAESLGMRASVYRYDDGGKIAYIGNRQIKQGVYFSIYFDAEHDAGKFVRPKGKQNSTRFVEWDGRVYSIRRVKSVTAQDYQGDVWNLTVDGRHTFQTAVGMSHNTVKPVDLMQWLVRLVTPKGGTTLDPFAGTGTTGEAAWREGMRAILIEREPEYQADIARRMELAENPTKRAAVAATKNKLEDPLSLPLFATLTEDTP